jgi:hypothetical protein
MLAIRYVFYISLQLLLETFSFQRIFSKSRWNTLRNERRYWFNIPLFLSAFNHNCNMSTQFGIKGSDFHLLSHWFLAGLILRSWRLKQYVPPKRRLSFNGLYSVISQKILLFVNTAVRTSDPTIWNSSAIWHFVIGFRVRCEQKGERVNMTHFINLSLQTHQKVGQLLGRHPLFDF